MSLDIASILQRICSSHTSLIFISFDNFSGKRLYSSRTSIFLSSEEIKLEASRYAF